VNLLSLRRKVLCPWEVYYIDFELVAHIMFLHCDDDDDELMMMSALSYSAGTTSSSSPVRFL